MSKKKVCPKCGSQNVKRKHLDDRPVFITKVGELFYGIWWLVKFVIALVLLVIWDWWYAIIMACAKKEYRWLFARLLFPKRKYRCKDCGCEFKA